MFKKIISVILSAACVLTLVGTSFMEPYCAYAQEEYSADIEAVLELVNEQRAAVGADPLVLNESLSEAATLRAEEIIYEFSHTRPDGSDYETVLDELGISCGYSGENIAAGYSEPTDVMDGWVESTGHYENIINENFGEIGIGICYDPSSEYGYYWVQIFADQAEPVYDEPTVTTCTSSNVVTCESVVTQVSSLVTQTSNSVVTASEIMITNTSISRSETVAISVPVTTSMVTDITPLATTVSRYLICHTSTVITEYMETYDISIVAENQNYTYQDTEYNLDDISLKIKYQKVYKYFYESHYSDGTIEKGDIIECIVPYDYPITEKADSSWEFYYTPAEYYEIYANYNEDIDVYAHFKCYLDEYGEYYEGSFPITISGPKASITITSKITTATTTSVTTNTTAIQTEIVYQGTNISIDYVYVPTIYCDYDDESFDLYSIRERIDMRLDVCTIYGVYRIENGERILCDTIREFDTVGAGPDYINLKITEYGSPWDMYNKLFYGKTGDYVTQDIEAIASFGGLETTCDVNIYMYLPDEITTTAATATSATTTNTTTTTSTTTNITTTTSKHLLYVVTGCDMREYCELYDVNVIAKNQNYSYQDTEYNLDDIYIVVEYREVHEYYDEYHYSDGTIEREEHEYSDIHSMTEYADSNWDFEYTPAEYYEMYASDNEDIEVEVSVYCRLSYIYSCLGYSSHYGSFPITISGPNSTTTAVTTAITTTSTLVSYGISETVSIMTSVKPSRYLVEVVTCNPRSYSDTSEVRLVAENQNYTYQDTEYNLDNIYLEIEYQIVDEWYNEYYYSDGTYESKRYESRSDTRTDIIPGIPNPDWYIDSQWEFEYTPAKYYEMYANNNEDIEGEIPFTCAYSVSHGYYEVYNGVIPITISGPKETTTTAVSILTTTTTTTERYIISSAEITGIKYKEISEINVVAENQNYTYQDTEYNLDDIYLEVYYEVIDYSSVMYYYSDGSSYIYDPPSYYGSEVIEANSSWNFEYTPAEYYEMYANDNEDIEVEVSFTCVLSGYGEYGDSGYYSGMFPITISGPKATTTAVTTTSISATATRPTVSVVTTASEYEADIFYIVVDEFDSNGNSYQYYTSDETAFNTDGVHVKLNGEDISSECLFRFNDTPASVYDGTNIDYEIPMSVLYNGEIIETILPVKIFAASTPVVTTITEVSVIPSITSTTLVSVSEKNTSSVTTSKISSETKVSTISETTAGKIDVTTTQTSVTTNYTSSESNTFSSTTEDTTISVTTSSKKTVTTTVTTTTSTSNISTKKSTTETSATVSETKITTTESLTSDTSSVNESEDIFVTVEKNGKLIIIDCSKNVVNVVIPISIDGEIVCKINDYALIGNNIEAVTFENPTCEICDSETTINKNAVIYGFWESTAHSYAEKYNREFISLNGEPSFEPGDADGSGQLDVRDAALIARMIAQGKKEELPEYADYNNDGDVNVRDAAAIARFLAS